MNIFSQIFRKACYFLISLFCFTLTAQNTGVKKLLSFQKESDSLIDQIVKDPIKNVDTLEPLLFDNIKVDSIFLDRKYSLVTALYKSKHYKRSISYFEEVIFLAKKQNNNEILIQSYFWLGNVYLRLWQNEKALEAYYNALDVDLKKGYNDYKVSIQPTIGIILIRMGQSERALKVCLEALSTISETRHYKRINHINIITIACEALVEIEDWENLRVLTAQGLKMSEYINYNIGIIDMHINLGILATQDTKYAKAEEHLNKASSLLDASGLKDKDLLIKINYFRVLKQYKQGDFKDAIDGLESIVKSHNKEEPQNEQLYIESTRLLAESYREIGNQDKSIYYYEKYTLLNEEYQLKNAAVVSSIINKEKALLDEQIEPLETRIFLNTTYKWLLFFVFCSILIGVVFYYRSFKKSNSESFNHLESLTKKTENLETQKEEVTNQRIKKGTHLDDEITNHILKALTKLEIREFYLKKDCSLQSMSREIKTNTAYLSHIINHHHKQSFNEYINDLRIEYALKRIQEDRKFRSFSIKSIAREVGYKSDYSFSKHFKAKTGVNPSNFIKQIKDLEIPT